MIPCDISADLRLERGGRTIHLSGSRSSLTLILSHWRDLGLLACGESLLQSARRLSFLSNSLARRGISLAVCTPERRLFSIGEQASSSIVGRLGLPPVRLHLLSANGLNPSGDHSSPITDPSFSFESRK